MNCIACDKPLAALEESREDRHRICISPGCAMEDVELDKDGKPLRDAEELLSLLEELLSLTESVSDGLSTTNWNRWREISEEVADLKKPHQRQAEQEKA